MRVTISFKNHDMALDGFIPETVRGESDVIDVRFLLFEASTAELLRLAEFSKQALSLFWELLPQEFTSLDERALEWYRSQISNNYCLDRSGFQGHFVKQTEFVQALQFLLTKKRIAANTRNLINPNS